MLVMYAPEADSSPDQTMPCSGTSTSSSGTVGAIAYSTENPAMARLHTSSWRRAPEPIGERARDRGGERGRVRQQPEEEAGGGRAPAEIVDVERRRGQQLQRRQEHGEAEAAHHEEARREQAIGRRAVTAGPPQAVHAQRADIREPTRRAARAPRRPARATGRSRGPITPQPATKQKLSDRQADSQCADEIGHHRRARVAEPAEHAGATPCRPSNSWKNAATNSRVMPSAMTAGSWVKSPMICDGTVEEPERRARHEPDAERDRGPPRLARRHAGPGVPWPGRPAPLRPTPRRAAPCR